MRLLCKTAAAAAALAAASLFASAQAQIGIGINVPGLHVRVGVPGYYYGPGYYPPGPCDAYDRYYEGDCGYAVYDGPVYFDGVEVGGPHYYRWYGDQPWFWYRGGWHTWAGWNRVGFGWDHREGYGWRDGHWDRDWGRAHWSGGRGDDRGGRGDDRGGRGDGDRHDDHRDRDRHDEHHPG